MEVCELCHELGIVDCKYCELGNPCLGCDDYDEGADKCRSNGGCAMTEDPDEMSKKKSDFAKREQEVTRASES